MKRIITLALTILCLATAGTTQAQIVGANIQRESLIKPKKQLPDYRPTGGLIQIDLGNPTALAVGTQLTSSFMVGGGIGIMGCALENDWDHGPWVAPVFVEMRLGTPKYNFSVFADLKLGFDICSEDDYNYNFFADRKWMRYPHASLQLGIMWRDFSLGVGPFFFFDEKNYSDYYKSGLNWDLCFSVSYRITFDAIRRVLL